MRHAHGPHVCETLPALTRVAPIYRYYCKCMLSHDHVFVSPDWILEKGPLTPHSSLHTPAHRLIASSSDGSVVSRAATQGLLRNTATA